MSSINQKPFHASALKLTIWYLAILMTVSLAFSVVIFRLSSQELDRPLPPDLFRSRSLETIEDIREAREERAAEGKQHLVVNLIVLNLVTLGLGTGASYLFARRTLKPIESAMEAQAQFVSDASHELRTPLAVIRTENEIALREKKPSVSDLKAIVASNLEEVERLQQLTDRLLALSSEQDLPISSFPIAQVIEEAISHHLIAAKQKRISLASDAAALSAIGHSETICDVLSILIDNAIKYSPSNTTVTVSASEHNRRIVVRVADEGVGITSEDKSRIFERFYRADQSRSKQHVEGHGLGLALAQRLALLNHAQLSVSDNSPKGTVFTLELDKA